MFGFFSRQPVAGTPRHAVAPVAEPVVSEPAPAQSLLTAQQTVQSQMVMHEALIGLKDQHALTSSQYETALPLGETLLTWDIDPIAASQIAAAIVTGVAAGQYSHRQLPARSLSEIGQKLFTQIEAATRFVRHRG